MSDLLPFGIHFDIADAIYRADPGLNQSLVKSFCSAPTLLHFKYLQDNPKPQSEAMRLGSAVDCLVSDADEFGGRFVLAPLVYPCEPTKKDPRTEKPWTLQSDWCKAWKAAREAEGKTFLTQEEKERVSGMVNALEANEDARRIIQNSKRQVVAIADHPALGFRMKALIDLFPDVNTEWLFDLKTAAGADCETFHDQCFKLNYSLQARWYLDTCRFAGVHVSHFGFVVVENEPPYGVKIHYYDYEDEMIQRAGLQYATAVPKLLECMKTNIWPGYGTDWSKVMPKPWMLKDRPQEGEALV